jgi:tetratricopeptide (TPR) repeat protein
MKRLLLPVLLAALPCVVQAADEADGKSGAHPPPAAAKPAALPDRELTPQILYQFLLAEIAGARGQTGLSAEAYVDLARSTRDPRIARRAAEIALFARRYDTALDMARLWAELAPDSPEARQMVTGLLAATNRADELANHLSRELAAAGSDVGAMLLRLPRMLGHYADKAAAQRLTNELTEPYLNVAEAHFVRAHAAHNIGDAALALAELDRALAIRPDWEQAALLRAQLTGDGAESARFLSRFLAANPKANDARIGYARSLVSDKRYAEARKEFQTLLAGNPDNGDVIYAVGVLSLQLNDSDEAARQFRRLVEMNHAEANSARFHLGQIAEDKRHWDEALGWYDAVTAGDRYLPARMRAAQVLMHQNKPEEARRALHEATATTPADRAQLLIGEAQLLRDAGRPDDAYAVLVEGLRAQPDQPELLYEAALTAERVGKVDVLEHNLRRLIEIKPDHAHAYNALGYSLADRNERLDEAATLIDKALQLSPEDPFILDSKGWLLFRKGDAGGAVDVLRKALTTRADPEIAAHLGEVLWSLGRRDEATRTWNDALQAHPGNEALVGAIKKFKP